jgi:hypothetical protein
MSYNNLLNPLLQGAVIAMTPYNSPPETVVAFDGFEIKWHQSSATSFDGIAIRSQSGTRSLRYTSVEFYVANAVADAGKVLWGSNNAWYALTAATAVANITNTVYPYAQNISTTFLGFGNPAMPNADYRQYVLYDDTNQATYLITVDKQASTGEILTAQNGTCLIAVERIGVTSTQTFTGTAPIVINSGAISLAVPYVRAMGAVTMGDLATAILIPAESLNIASASILSGGGTAVMVMQINFATAMPDTAYKIAPSILASLTEAAAANATIDMEIAVKTINGFRVIFRETVSAVQSATFEFTVTR